MAGAWLVGSIIIAVLALLALVFHRRLTPEGRGPGPLVAGALIVLVIALVLIAAILGTG